MIIPTRWYWYFCDNTFLPTKAISQEYASELDEILKIKKIEGEDK